MQAHSASSYVLLVRWQSGATEQHQIPADGVVRLGLDSEPVASVVPLYGNGPSPVGQAVVRGPEVPSMTVAPTPDDLADDQPPEWLSEFMAELGRRHNIRTPEGCEAAMHEAANTSDSFGFRCRSCAALARGYRSAGGALAAILEEDQDAWSRHNGEASRHFRESVELARQGELVGA
ncbi:MAG: hypothetical protein JW940_00550 [Polyangiaceae bacterium]|nr:hypothetical protein [Polyangiaceae bacterium]